MDLSLSGVAEKLATEFPELRRSTVVAVVSECAHSLPRADPYFVEHASRARLRLLRQLRARRLARAADAGSLSRQRADLDAEGELTTRLMTACQGSDEPLGQDDVDRILGLGVTWLQPLDPQPGA